MELKQAVSAAKAHLLDVFSAEMMSDPRLEEVWFDDADQVWCVTFGFFRKPDDLLVKVQGSFSTFDYKVVRVGGDSGKPISIRNRERAAA
jgi:type IV secretory pathway ATPase VirB11/archaellum biosynthesis ATPase